MKYHISLLELWILEHLFQRFSDFTYRWFRLTNFFWAVTCTVVTMSCFTYMTLKCLYDGRYSIILGAIPIFSIFVPATVYSIRKARIHAYDHATWGVENPLKVEDSKSRCHTLLVTLSAITMWLIISYKLQHYPFGTLVLWISMTGYPTLSFCACNVPGRRF